MLWILICLASLLTGGIAGGCVVSTLSLASEAHWQEFMQRKVQRAQEEARWYRASAERLAAMIERDQHRGAA